LLNDIMDSFLKSSISYLSHPDFATKYVLKEYKTFLKRQKWYNEEIFENC
jgi:hypothetical protein